MTQPIYRWDGEYFGFISNGYLFDREPILPVYFSHGKGDMPAKVGDKFRQSLKINEEQFRALRDCPLTKEDYINILKSKGLV